MGTNQAETAPEYLTALEVAKRLNVSLWTVYRRFGNLPGVIDLSDSGTRRRKLRIPRSVLDKYILRHQVR